VRKEVRGDGMRSGKLKGGKYGWMRDSVVRKGETTGVCPRGFRGRRMVEGGKEKEFACKIAKGTKGINSKGEEEYYMIGIEMGNDGFVAKFAASCFVVCFV
jgi:hypothetical protein